MPSSVIQSFSYDEARHELAVRFTSGRVYLHADVPVDIADGLARAESKGRFFNLAVRDRFRYRRRR
jgi:hypothetical protein